MQLALKKSPVQVGYANRRTSLDSAIHNMLVHINVILNQVYGEGHPWSRINISGQIFLLNAPYQGCGEIRATVQKRMMLLC